MTRVLETPADRLAAVLWTTCRDRWVVSIAGVAGVGAVVQVFGPRPLAATVAGLLAVGLPALVAAQVQIVLRDVRDAREASFWRDLGLAFAVWSATVLLGWIVGDRTGIVGAVLDAAGAAIILLMLAAAERHPHLHGPWRPSAAEHRVRWPAVAMLVFGWTFYFVGVPRMAGAEPSPGTIVLCRLVLGGLVTLRWGLLSRRADIRRWRRLYAALAVATATGVGVRAIDAWALVAASAAAADAVRLLNAVPLVLFAFAIALSRHRSPPRLTAGPATSGLARLAGGQAGVLAAWALLVPAIHGTLHGFGLLDAGTRTLREALVVAGVLALGGAAVWEHHLRRQRLLAARGEQRRVEDTLRTREQDLRLILERRRGRDVVRRSEEQFASAFRASPDGLAISTLDDGRLLEVNPSFARIVGRSASELVGQPVAKLDLWPDLDQRGRIIDLVRRDGSARDIDLAATIDGRPLAVRASFEAIQVGADTLLLTVLRDRTAEWLADRPLARTAGWLDRSAAAVRGLDAVGRTTYRNPAALAADRRGELAARSRRFEVELDDRTEAAAERDEPTTRTRRLVFVATAPPDDSRSAGDPEAAA